MNTLKYKGFIGSVAFSEADGVFLSINAFIKTAVEKQIAAMR